MMQNTEERRIVASKARRWRDLLRTAPVVKLTTGERFELAHVLDELQWAVEHGAGEGAR